ncbi:hypothetical protein MRX96_002665 [Rhipicephalus microplus]
MIGNGLQVSHSGNTCYATSHVTLRKENAASAVIDQPKKTGRPPRSLLDVARPVPLISAARNGKLSVDRGATTTTKHCSGRVPEIGGRAGPGVSPPIRVLRGFPRFGQIT